MRIGHKYDTFGIVPSCFLVLKLTGSLPWMLFRSRDPMLSPTVQIIVKKLAMTLSTFRKSGVMDSHLLLPTPHKLSRSASFAHLRHLLGLPFFFKNISWHTKQHQRSQPLLNLHFELLPSFPYHVVIVDK